MATRRSPRVKSAPSLPPASTAAADPSPLREDHGRLLVPSRVTPRAARNEVTFDGATLRVHVTAAPVAGAANAAVIALLARRLRLPKSRVAIAHGATSHDKLVAIEGLTAAELRARLGT
jgi:uncharacterized protein YggU (UPF0235/DUF167 family)